MATLHKFNLEKPDGYVWFGERQEVAGTHYRQKEFRKAISRSGEFHFLLEREPGNKYDSNAVKFIIDYEGRQYHIGYLDAETAAEIAAEVNNGTPFDWFKVLPVKIDEYRDELHLIFSLFWPDKKNRTAKIDPLSREEKEMVVPDGDIVVYCPRCHQKYRIDGSYVGSQAECEICKFSFQVAGTPKPTIDPDAKTIREGNENTSCRLKSIATDFVNNKGAIIASVGILAVILGFASSGSAMMRITGIVLVIIGCVKMTRKN